MAFDIFAAQTYQEDLHERNFQDAVKLGVEYCVNCGECCYRRPCIPTPRELQIIAEHLLLSLKDAVRKYFVADKFGRGLYAFIFPAKKSQLDLWKGNCDC